MVLVIDALKIQATNTEIVNMGTAHDDYRRLENRSRLMDLATDFLFVFDANGWILDLNRAAAAAHGGEVEDYIGRNCGEFLSGESLQTMVEVGERLKAAGADGDDRFQVRRSRFDGTIADIEVSTSWSHEQQMFYVVERDVSERVEQERIHEDLRAELQKLALNDSLTGIGNRNAFERQMELVETRDSTSWLILTDIDDFKAINDGFGHLAGDAVLRGVADRLTNFFPYAPLIARIGGDEFAVLLDEADPTVLQRRLSELSTALDSELVLDQGRALHMSSSIGASQREPGEAAQEWYRRSDRELYASKHQRVAA